MRTWPRPRTDDVSTLEPSLNPTTSPSSNMRLPTTRSRKDFPSALLISSTVSSVLCDSTQYTTPSCDFGARAIDAAATVATVLYAGPSSKHACLGQGQPSGGSSQTLPPLWRMKKTVAPHSGHLVGRQKSSLSMTSKRLPNSGRPPGSKSPSQEHPPLKCMGFRMPST